MKNFKNEKKSNDDDRLFAKVIDKSEYAGKTKNDISFFECNYIIRCVDGPYEGRQFRIRDLGPEVIIGTDEKANFFLKDCDVSPMHTKLKYIDNTFYYTVEDLGSDTGTWIKVSSLDDGYEIKEQTSFLLLQHEFEVSSNEGVHQITFTKGGPSNGRKVYTIGEEEGILIGKKDALIQLEMQCPENLIYKFTKTKGRVFVISECQENSNLGLFYRLHKNETSLIRAGDIIKIGRSSFRFINHNWGVFSEIGDRPHQEDKYCIVDDLRIFDDIIVPYYAIYDGHGGITCSQYLQKNLHNNLREFLKLKNLSNSENFITDFCKAVQEIIIYTDICYYETEDNYSIHHGSTAVILFFIGNKVICCNLGDSISILIKKDKKIYLSRDFKPSREEEKNRISKKNGFITSDGRLLGLISVSRAFGDWKYKDKKKHPSLKKVLAQTENLDEYLISNRAEFRIIEINPDEDRYILIVSDGIFQHCNNDNEILNIIDEYLQIEKTENSNIKSIPNVVDNVRLHIINSIYGDSSLKGKADNMTLIMVPILNDKI